MKIGTKLLLLLTVVFAISTLASAVSIGNPVPVNTSLTNAPGNGGPTDIAFFDLIGGGLTLDSSNDVTGLNNFMGSDPSGDMYLLTAWLLTSPFVPTSPDLTIDEYDPNGNLLSVFNGTLFAESANAIAGNSVNAQSIFFEFDPPNFPIFAIDLHPNGGNNDVLDFYQVPSAVPEPSSIFLILSGAGAVLPCVRRKRSA